MRRNTILLGNIVLLTALVATAQENRSEISVQGTGFFTKSASGNGTAYSTTDTGGFEHILVSLESLGFRRSSLRV